jgi:hypothetical protein
MFSSRISALEIKNPVFPTRTAAHWHESNGRRARRVRVVPAAGVTTTQEKFETGRVVCQKCFDKQHVAAVGKLEAMGYTFAAGDWMQPANDAAAVVAPVITDALHALLVVRADELMSCPEVRLERASCKPSPMR